MFIYETLKQLKLAKILLNLILLLFLTASKYKKVINKTTVFASCLANLNININTPLVYIMAK